MAVQQHNRITARGDRTTAGTGTQGKERRATMSERSIDKREKEYNDSIPDPEEEFPEADEETYRDGSAKNECWSDKNA